jgi:hypothetical protein
MTNGEKLLNSPPSHKMVGPIMNLISETYHSCEGWTTHLFVAGLLNDYSRNGN